MFNYMFMHIYFSNLSDLLPFIIQGGPKVGIQLFICFAFLYAFLYGLKLSAV